MLWPVCVALAVSRELDVVDCDRIVARLACGDSPKHPLIADIGTVLQSNLAGTEGSNRYSEPELGREVGPIGAEAKLSALSHVPEAQVLDPS